jgi:AraC-like DNA-binding protein
MGVRFKPGMAHPFFYTSMHALTDKIVDFDEFFGREANMLSDTLTIANSINDRIAILNRAFSRRLSTLIPVDAAIGRALQLICHTLGRCSVEKISCEIGWSRQHLTRKCLRYTGLTPKFLSQTIRINTLIKHYQNKNPQNWSAFALESGFYDQAHMINTFKKITGCTPLEFLK